MMGSSSRNIIDVFIKLIQSLECPVCYEYVATPIWQCEAGHIICNQCKCSVHNCPTCRRTFSSVRVRSLEQISDLMLFPCKNDGCEKILPLTDIKYHENTCSLANASSRPDEFGRSTILQYNILKYIEHDIAPFFITGRQSHERGTQTDSERWRSNVKDASTMAEPNSSVELEPVGSSKQGEITAIKTVTPSKLNFDPFSIGVELEPVGSSKQDEITAIKTVTPSKLNFDPFSIGSPNQKSSIPNVHFPPNASVNKKTLNTAVRNRAALNQSKKLNFVTSRDEVIKKIEPKPNIKGKSPSSVASEKLSDLFRDNERKLTYTKGSTKYDCFLQSTSSKSGGIGTTTKNGFDFSPFINKSPTSHPLPNDVANYTSEPTFKFVSRGPTPSNSKNISESVQGPPSFQPLLGNDSVFCFQTRNQEACETNEPRTLAQIHFKEKRFDGNKHRRSHNLNRKGSLVSEENRTEVAGTRGMPSMNTTTASSSNATDTNVIQSVNTPVFSPIIFSDITYSETFKGTLESFSQKAAAAFNNKKQWSDTFLPPETSTDLLSLKMNRPSEDIGSQPSASKISSMVANNDLGSGMPFSISRNTDPLDSLPTNSTTISLDSCSSSVPSGEGNSSVSCQANSAINTSFGSKNNEESNFSSSSIDISRVNDFQALKNNPLPLETGLDYNLASDSSFHHSKTRISGSPIFSYSNSHESMPGTEITSSNANQIDSKSLRTCFPPQSLNDIGSFGTFGNSSVSARDPPSIESINNSSQLNNQAVLNQATESAAAPLPGTSSCENTFLFPPKISDSSKKVVDNTKSSFFRNSYNFGKNSNVLKQLGNSNSTQYKSAQNITILGAPNSINLENVVQPVQQMPSSLSFTTRATGNTGDSLSLGLSYNSSETDTPKNCPFPVTSVQGNSFESEIFNFCSQSVNNSTQNLTPQTSWDSDKHGNSESDHLINNSGNIFPGSGIQSCPGTSGSSEPLPDTNSIVETTVSMPFNSKSHVPGNTLDNRDPTSGASLISEKKPFTFSTPSSHGPRNMAFPLSISSFTSNEPFPCFFKTSTTAPSGADLFCPLLKDSERKTSFDPPYFSDSGINRHTPLNTDSTLQSDTFTSLPFNFGSKSNENSTSSDKPLFTYVNPPSLSYNPLFTFGRENNTLWDSERFDSTSRENVKSSGFSHFFRDNGPKKQ